MTPDETQQFTRRRRARNWAMLLALLGLVVLFFLITVARRSPAMTTPPAKVSATMVVPCGTSRPGVRGAAVCPRRSIPSGIRPGSRCGAVAAR